MSSDDEELFTGWSPDAPADDTFGRAFTLSLAEGFLVAAEQMGRRSYRAPAWRGADYGVPAGFGNTAVLTQPLISHEGDRTAAVIDEIEQFYGRGKGDVLVFSAWPTPDLRPRGWLLFGHPPLMVRAGGGDAPPVPVGLRIEPVATGPQLVDFTTTVVEAFPVPEAEHLLPDRLLDARVLADGRWRFFVGYEGDRPVATAAAFVAYGHNDVTYVSNRPECRGKGYGAALTWAATLADPALPAGLLASDLGRPVYERMGYSAVSRWTLWGWPRG